MCTVSVIQSQGQIIITSNRDEKTTRPTALEPQIYSINNKKILFPKDPVSGGTWFGVDENANIAVLLNGAEKKHTPRSSYRKSRGLILLEIIGDPFPLPYWNKINLKNIEPFSMILLEQGKLHQLQWNGSDKKCRELPQNKNFIWSSATLFSKPAQKLRRKWFNDFIANKCKITQENMLSFHQETQSQDPENGLLINRKNSIKTLSITQSVIQKNKVNVKYIQLNPRQTCSHTHPIV